jgi:hypothetical protein
MKKQAREIEPELWNLMPNSWHQRDPQSFFVAEVILNNSMCFVYTHYIPI